METIAACEAVSAGTTAPAMFSGYLLLDAWVANQDRHDQNWAVIHQAAAPGGLRLAASYDHASSLGFNLLDTRRESLLGRDGVEAWAARAVAHRFERAPQQPKQSIPTLVEVAHQALDIAGSSARQHWMERVRTLGINRRRLLHER
ncbi:MAG: hypothetical protein L0K86_15025 [Actinomycetia bacterium]|nr:hypothetical protein [Actinomycetes bacterium]